jgi:uncharacterized membrane protein
MTESLVNCQYASKQFHNISVVPLLLNLRYNINAKIKDILSTLKTFGLVFIGASHPSVVMKTMKAKQAQIMSVIQHPYVK